MIKVWLNCEETGRLTSDAFDRPLTRREQLGVILHRFYCRRCAALARDLAALRAALQRLAKGVGAEALPGPQLTEDRLKQLRAAVKAAAKASAPTPN